MTTHAMQGVAGLVCVSVVDQVIRASQPVISAAAFNEQRLPTDPIGTTIVTFSGVPAGSEIRVYDPSANELAGIESCAADQVLTWAVYAAGSPNNTVRIVIIDMTHRIKEFSYTSQVGNQSIPVQPENDKWYVNP